MILAKVVAWIAVFIFDNSASGDIMQDRVEGERTMPWFRYFWSDEPRDNVEKLADHGLTADDFQFVFENCESEDASYTSERLIRFGHTRDGRFVAVVFEWDEVDVSVIPVTAYEIDPV